MRWKPFLYLIAFLILCGLAFLWIFQRTAENFIENQLQNYKQEVQNREDGSKFRYGDININKNILTTDLISYKDGSSGEVLNLYLIEAQGSSKNIDHLEIARGEYVNASGAMISFENLKIDDLTSNDNSQDSWNRYLFESFELKNVISHAKLKTGENVELLAERVDITNFKGDTIDLIQFKNLSIQRGRNARMLSDMVEFEALDYVTLLEAYGAWKAGFFPIKMLSKLDLKPSNIGNLTFEYFGKKFNLPKNLGDTLSDKELLDLFINNAPSSLKDLLGAGNNGEIGEIIDNLNEKQPEQLLEDGLNLMLDLLKNQNKQSSSEPNTDL